MASSIEIEIQVRVERTKRLIQFLKKNGKFVGKKHQVDQYFTPAHRNFLGTRPTKEWLRLRNSSGNFSINYKNWHIDKNGRCHHCDEYESSIGDIKQLKNIFTALNLKSLTVVDKVRSIWLYQGLEIAIDSVKGLGDFLEIELKADSKGKAPAEITSEMVAFLKKFDCGIIKRNYVGYPFRLLFPNEVTEEEV